MDKKRDDEKLFWFIGGGLFAAVLIAVDIWYSSYPLMFEEDKWMVYLIGLAHLVIIGLWIGVGYYFEDPNYDYLRKWCVYLTGATIIIVCLYHALTNENKQILIDAENERKRDSIEQVQHDSTMKAKDSLRQVRVQHAIDSMFHGASTDSVLTWKLKK